jgi:hypothetical protein
MTNSTTSLEPGWRPDPSGRYEYRYWDGQWTNRVANSTPGAGPAASPSAPSVPAPTVPTVPAAPAPAAPEHRPGPMDTAPPPPASVLAVVAAVGNPAAPFAPFGVDDPAALRAAPAEPEKPAKARVGIWARIGGFFRSFVDEDESYKSPLAGPDIEPRHRHVLEIQSPANYGRAGIVALAAGGLATGAYLPWLQGVVDDIPFHRTGFDMGRGWGFWFGALALAIAALLSVQMRKVRWVAMGVAIALTGLVIRDLLDAYNTMQKMNLAPNASAQIGMGLWIMVGSAAVAMIAGFRLGEDDKMV